MQRSQWVLSAWVGLCLCCGAAVMAAEPDYQMPETTVIGVTPVLGSGLPADQVPTDVQTVRPEQTRDAVPRSAAEMLELRLGSVAATDYAGNPLQPSLQIRGFTASPVLGEPQGVAVYQNGMRLNEAFGDVVNWEMNPSFAIDTAQVLPGSNPVFGLNALGGAVALKMKDGFSNPGTHAELAGGSFGRGRFTAETGQSFGDFGFYTGVSGQTDDGWRQSSPSKLIQSYTDLALRRGDLDLGAGITVAASDLSGLGTTPVELLDRSRSAVFSSPDQTQNVVAALDLRGQYQLSQSLAFQGSFYYRHLRTATHNGDVSDFEACDDDPDQICDDNGPLTDRQGNPVPATVGGNGVFNNTVTTTDGIGAAGQVTHQSRLAGRDNTAIFGVSTDQGWTDYKTNSEIGQLSTLRATIGSGVYLGGSDYNVRLDAHNAYYGVYLTDSFSITKRLTLTVAGRFNAAQVDLTDRLGTALSGDHSYQRFNPSAGLSWQVMPWLTLFGNYSEANRVPTAAELSCADPDEACRVPNAFISDPDLKQVIARTGEIGARGSLALPDKGRFSWSVAGFTTRNSDDIIFISSGPFLGSGYFTNAGHTLRQGLDAHADLTLGRLNLFVGYGLVRAVFDSPEVIQSPFNAAADANGNIAVKAGDRLPGVPLHSIKLGAGYQVTSAWRVGTDARIFSDRVFRGDESNTMPKLGGYAVVNLSSDYQVMRGVDVFLRIQNLFDRDYASAGTLGDPTSLFPAFTDNRFETPGEPRSFWLGTRFSF